jgi:hypothetical protein
MIKNWYRLLVVFVLNAAELVTNKEYSRLESYREGFQHGVIHQNVYKCTGLVRFADYYLLGHERGKKFAEKKGF